MAKTKAMLLQQIKEEITTPKKVCLNACLMPAKTEDASPPPPPPPGPGERSTSPDSSESFEILSGKAPPAERAHPRSYKSFWDKYRVVPGRFIAMSLSSPSPNQANTKRKAAPLDEPERCFSSLRPLPADLATGDTAQNHINAATPRVRDGARVRGTNENKKIHNAYNARKARFEALEPEVSKHLADLQKTNPPGCPQVLQLKKAIGQCRGSNFDTPEIQEVKKD